MDVLGLLRSKNRCLRRFLETSAEFLAEAGRSERLPDVVAFESRREAILKAIDLYDRKIREAVFLLGSGPRPQASPPETLPKELTEGVRAALDEKTALIHRILATDDRILALIDAEKAKVLKELSSTQKQEGITKKFRSTWVPESGEGIDEKL